MNTKIVTYTGKIFDLLNPTPDMVCIEDIAHALSQLCRYTGHTRGFYSVAQHCVLMARHPNLPGDLLAKLLHDAHEAYTGDMASPWKQLLFIGNFNSIGLPFEPLREYEQKIQDVIGLALGVDLSHSAEVKESDNQMYATEIRDLMPQHDELKLWKGNLEPIREEITPWESKQAEKAFMLTYRLMKTGKLL